MKAKLLSILALLLTMVTQGAGAQQLIPWIGGSGTAEDPYLITSETDWDAFALALTTQTTFHDKCFKLTADISVTTMVSYYTPSDDVFPFKGTFDGDGHTLTVNINSETDNVDAPAAPFAYLSGATIQNLNVAGTITTKGRHPAGIASFVTGEGTTTITNCRSSVAITSSYAADIDAGGFVGRVNKGNTLTMSECVFTGSITYTNADGCEGGGLVGWTQELATSTLTNCLFAPSAMSIIKWSGSPFNMFAIGHYASTININSCFYDNVAAGIKDIGTQGKPFPTAIAGDSDWEDFATVLALGYEDYSGQTVKLTGNINVTKVAGAIDHPFKGTFDGQGHTLSVNINVESDDVHTPAAPFAELSGATIQDLSVEGSITTKGMRPAGIASFVADNSTITNCKSSVNITSSYGSDIDAGGFVGRVSEGKSLTMTGCTFAGSIKYSNAGGYEGGGMVGWLQDGASAALTNCLFVPSSISFTNTFTSNDFNTFAGGWGSRDFTNCYFNDVAANEPKITTPEGVQMHSISAGDKVTRLVISGDSTVYKVSGIAAYAKGFKYDKVCYAANGDEVPLSLVRSAPSEGIYFHQYVVEGGGTLANPATDTPTLTMTDANQTIGVQWLYTEAPWRPLEMKTHVCPYEDASLSVSFNEMNNQTWDVESKTWKDGDGVGCTIEGTSQAQSIMGFFTTYVYEASVLSYSSLRLTMKYQLSSKSTRHPAMTRLYARQGNYSDLTDMAVDFTTSSEPQAGSEYLLESFYNPYENGETAKDAEKTTVIEFDNLNGSWYKSAVCHLLLTHVVACKDDLSTLLVEWGAFKNIEYNTSWTYRLMLSYDANGGSGTMSGQTMDSGGHLSPNAFTRAGYTFQGWAKAPDGDVVYADGAEIAPTADNKGPVTLYAKWKEEEGPVVPREQGPWKLVEWRTMSCGNSECPAVAFNNMNNVHWGTVAVRNDENGIGFTVTGSSPDNGKNGVFSLYSMTKNMPSYAKCRITWGYQIGSFNAHHYSRVQLFAHPDAEALKAMDADFTVDGESGSCTDHRLAYLYNDTFTDLPVYSPLDGSYEFELDNINGTINTDMSHYLMLTHASSSIEGLSDLNEWGVFKHLNLTETWTYRRVVSFNANGGEGTMDDQIIDNSGTLTPNSFTREGYTFAGWATSANGDVVYADGAEMTATDSSKGPLALYAKWGKDIILADNADNSTVISENNGLMANVTLQGRTLYKDGDWNTLCLPFDVSEGNIILEGAIVKELDVEGIYDTDKQTGYDPESGTLSLYFKDATAIEAGKPYLVKWASGDNIVSPVFTGVTVSNVNTPVISEDHNVEFRGNYSPVLLPGNDASYLYLGTQNKLYWPSADKTINAFRAYFHVDLDGQTQVRNIVLNLDEDNPTAVEMKNEKLKMKNEASDDAVWYDLSGRRLTEKPTKSGIYIRGGKKVSL